MFKKLIRLALLVLLIVSAILPGCGGGSSSKKSDSKPIPAPAAPSYITVTPADKQLTIEWITIYDATGYEVWYSTSNDPSTATQITESFTGTSCIISDLTNGTTYYVWVRATNSGGTSDWSSVGTGKPVSATNPPNAPKAPTLKGRNKEVIVIWESVTGATSYEVWYATTNNTGSAVKATSLITGTGTTITGLNNGSTYYVWVKAQNSEGTSNFSTGSKITLEIVYNGSIRGMVNSAGSYSVILVEQSKVLNFNSKDYFYFNNLPPGTYHVRIERTGYEGIIKEVNLAQDAIVELGTFNPDSNPLPNGNGFIVNSFDYKPLDDTRTVPSTAVAVTVYYSLYYSNAIKVYRNDSCIYSRRPSQPTESSYTFPDNLAGTYRLYVESYPMHGNYGRLEWKVDNGAPKISINKNWANSTDMVEIFVDCSDSISGLKSAHYYVSQTTVKPSNFNAMPAQYNVQISKKGTRYLHVQAIDNKNNATYRCVGPFIIQ